MKRPVFCLRKTLYPKPLNFFLKKLISLSPLKGNRAFHFISLLKKIKIKLCSKIFTTISDTEFYIFYTAFSHKKMQKQRDRAKRKQCRQNNRRSGKIFRPAILFGYNYRT